MQCYLVKKNVVGIIHKGERGYYKTELVPESREEGKQLADGYNRNLGIPKRQAAAMVAGSMFGWETPRLIRTAMTKTAMRFDRSIGIGTNDKKKSHARTWLIHKKQRIVVLCL